MLLLWLVGAAVGGVPGTNTTVAPPAASVALYFRAATGEDTSPAGRCVWLSALDQAQKTLLFDPVFSAQLAQPQQAGIGGEQARVAGSSATPPGTTSWLRP